MNILIAHRSTFHFHVLDTTYTIYAVRHHAPLSATPSIMSIFSRASLIIIAISAPALAIRDPGYSYYPHYYTPNTPYRKNSPPNPNDHSGGARLSLLEMSHLAAPPVQTRPTYALPAYAPLAYHHTTSNPMPTYPTPTVPTIPQQLPPVVRPDQPHNLPADTPAYKLPTDSQVNKPPADGQAYERPAYELAYRLPVYNHAYRPPVDTPAHKPLAENAVSEMPIPLTTPTETATDVPAGETAAYSLEYSILFDEPVLPKQEHGKPSPLPHIFDRRNAPRVPRQKIGKSVKGTTPRGRHARRIPFLKKRQQETEQRTMVPVTVNMLTGVGPAPSTSSAPPTTLTNALPPGQSPIAPDIKVDNSQAALSLHSNPEATTPSGGKSTPPISYKGGQQNGDFISEPRNKATVIASVLSIMLGLVVIITIVKLTSNAMRKRKHAGRLGQYEEHLGSKEGLIPEMSDQAHFETHNVIITRPDGSQISPIPSSRGDSPSPPSFRAHVVGSSPSPLPMPTFAPPPVPANPLSMSFAKLLSPTANLAQQNLTESRASTTSETMSMSTTSTDMSDRERRPTSDDEYLGRQVSHRRMRSAPGSVVWSARSSSATGKMTSGLSGEEGYWESVELCGSESVGRMSRGRSVAMSVMW